MWHTATHCNTLQHTTPHCNIHTHTHTRNNTVCRKERWIRNTLSLVHTHTHTHVYIHTHIRTQTRTHVKTKNGWIITSQTNESCHVTHMDESHHKYERIKSHIRKRHTTYMNLSWHAYEQITSHIRTLHENVIQWQVVIHMCNYTPVTWHVIE